jgi:methyl-accepting chemotaxis protein
VANSVKSLAERSLDSAEKIGDIVEANRKTITDVTDTLRRLNG